MNRAGVIEKLRAAEPALRKRGVAALFLFGSYGRDAAGSDSDIDVFVDALDDTFFDLINYMQVYAELKSAFPGVQIGYSTREGLSKFVRPLVEHDAVRVF